MKFNHFIHDYYDKKELKMSQKFSKEKVQEYLRKITPDYDDQIQFKFLKYIIIYDLWWPTRPLPSVRVDVPNNKRMAQVRVDKFDPKTM